MARPVAVFGIGLTAAERTLVVQAAPPQATVMPLATVAEAMNQAEAVGPEVLVLGIPSSGDREAANAVLGRDGLPRWAVVGFEPAALPARMAEAVTLLEARREAARARGDLLTLARRISHEIRSPLGCILTSAHVLLEEAEEGAPGSRALLEPIVESANEVLALIDRVSLIARASATTPARTAVDVGLSVWTARGHLAAKIAAAEAEVSEPEEWPVVTGVAEWLERIWYNLLANAVQHGGPRPRIHLGWVRQAGDLRFFVRDEGPGVAADVTKFLFRSFHQLHENDAGRGLGLAIVRRLVELHGGTCGYEPAVSGGSNFFFVLPASSAA